MKNTTCIAPPPPPPPPLTRPIDWNDAVGGNCFSNLERLGQWTGGTTTLDAHTDPSKHFEKVAPGSLGAGPNPVPVYVVTHGWAPGYRSVVHQHGGQILWWDKDAHDATGVWTSNWAWVETVAETIFFGDVTVSATGLLQQIASFEPNAVVLAYSWIDDSATGGDLFALTEVYQSEAYTQINGIRLANALEQAIAPSFWTEGGSVRLLGHSHGAKVMTVAALTLQTRGRPVAHLSTLDSPETVPLFSPVVSPLKVNAANMLGFYLEQLQICDPTAGGASGGGGVFADNTASYFGVSYAGAGKLVNVALDPFGLYDPPVTEDGIEKFITDVHKYAATWYSGAEAGAKAHDLPALGLAWPPVSRPHVPALNQNWRSDDLNLEQWVLDLGPSIRDTFTFSTKPLKVTTDRVQGNVVGDPSRRLIFGGSTVTPTTYSFFEGLYGYARDDQDNYGIAFDLIWIKPGPGDYFVVAMENFAGIPEVLLVMDGQSFPGGQTSVAINCDVFPGHKYAILMYFWAKADTTVVVSNFRSVVMKSQSGLLEASRKASAQERLSQVVTHSRRRGNTPQTPPA